MGLEGQFWIRGTASPRTPSRPRSRGPLALRRSGGGAWSRAAVQDPPVHRHSKSDDGGYILVALLVGIAIAAVWMSAALPSWRQQATREKEAELIFRGEQYARAIFLYSQKMNGALPASFDDLVSQHTLRHKWKDPITGDDFLPKVGCQTGIPAGGGAVPGSGQRQGAAPGNAPPVRSGPPLPVGGAQGGRPAGQTPIQPGRGPTPGGQIPGGQGQAGQGGICGVQSKSKAASIKIYNGQQEYDLWQFDILTARLQFQNSVVRLGGGAGQGIGLPANSPRGRGVQQPGNQGVPPGPGGRVPPMGAFPPPPGSGGPIAPGGGRTGR